MRSDLLLVSLVAGCAFSGEVDPTTNAGVVANLVADAAVEGAVLLAGPADVPWDDPNAATSAGIGAPVYAGEATAALAAHTGADGETALTLHRFVGGGVDTVVIEPQPSGELLGRAGDEWVAWGCGEGALVQWVADGDDAVSSAAAPSTTCPDALGQGPGGALLAATFDGAGFLVETWTLGGGGLASQGQVTLPSGAAYRAWQVGDDGAGPWVLGGTGASVTWSGPDGLAELPDVGLPAIAVRDGEAWLVAFDQALTLSRWTPATGGLSEVGTVQVDASYTSPLGQHGVVAARVEPWVEYTSIITEAWWLAPGDGPFTAEPLPASPCDDVLACFDIGEWAPVGVIETPDGPWGVWSVWAWLGPTAVVAAPLSAFEGAP